MACRLQTETHFPLSCGTLDYATLAVAKHGRLSWKDSRHKARDITFLNMSLEAAYARFFGDQTGSSTSYEVCHASVFTPASFALLAQECHAIVVSPLALDFVSTTRGHEFFVHLRLAEREPINHHDRMQLLTLTAKEQSYGFQKVKTARGSLMRTMLKGLIDRVSDLVLP